MRADSRRAARPCRRRLRGRIASSDVVDGLPDGGRAVGRQAVDGPLEAARSVVGATSRLAWPEKLTRPTWYWRGTSSAKRQGGVLRRAQPVGCTSVGGHRAGDVHGEHDRRPLARLVAASLGAGQGEREGRPGPAGPAPAAGAGAARAGVGPRRPGRGRGGDARGGAAAAPPHDGAATSGTASSASRKRGSGRSSVTDPAAATGRPSERASGSTQSRAGLDHDVAGAGAGQQAPRAASVVSTVAAKRRGSAGRTCPPGGGGRSRGRAAAPGPRGHVALAAVAHLDGDDLVPAPEGADGALEAGLQGEVRDEHDRRRGGWRCGPADEMARARSVRPPEPSGGGTGAPRRRAPRPGRAGRRAAGAPGRCRRRGW